MRLPTSNPVTLPFGSTADPYSAASPHKGTDFSYLPDDTIYAPADVTVQLVPNNGNDGNGVYMTVGTLFIGVLHTSKYLVADGATVKEGDPIAVMGDTGLAFGKHLHLAVKSNGAFIDPLTVMKGDNMATQSELDLVKYQLDASEKALRAREEQAAAQQRTIDLLDYKQEQSEAALRVREQQAADLQKQIDALSAKSKYTPVTDQLYTLDK